MRRLAALDVRFCVAAGPRRGYGHLVRCRALADAMGVRPRLSIRGVAAARAVARALGCVVRPLTPSALRRERPHLLVVDDPSGSMSARWVRAARAAGVPIATIHDLGLGLVRSDLTIDGSLSGAGEGRHADLAGALFAVLHPAVHRLRSAAPERRRGDVLITLGGGVHVRRHGIALARRIRQLAPHVTVAIAPGFSGRSTVSLPGGCRWVRLRGGLAADLARTGAVVAGGGVTLYEACALGTPVVALAVVPAQRRTIRAFARLGAVVDAGGVWQRPALGRAAAAVVGLLSDPIDAAARARLGRAAVDGRGAARVARHLHALVAQHAMTEGRRAA